MKYLQIHPWNHQIQLNQVNQANPSRKKNLICTAYQYCFSFDDWPTDHFTCSIQNNKYNNTALVCLQLSHLKHDVLGSCICVKPKLKPINMLAWLPAAVREKSPRSSPEGILLCMRPYKCTHSRIARILLGKGSVNKANLQIIVINLKKENWLLKICLVLFTWNKYINRPL